MPADVEPKLKQHIEIVWPNDGQWYSATVVNYSAELRKHGILYARERQSGWTATAWIVAPRSTDLLPEAHETKRIRELDRKGKGED